MVATVVAVPNHVLTCHAHDSMRFLVELILCSTQVSKKALGSSKSGQDDDARGQPQTTSKNYFSPQLSPLTIDH